MSELCEHETFKDICGTCHRDAQITSLTAENEKLRAALQLAFDELAYAMTLDIFNTVRAALEEK